MDVGCSQMVYLFDRYNKVSFLAAEKVTGCKLFGKYLSWAADTIFPSHCFLENDDDDDYYYCYCYCYCHYHDIGSIIIVII